MISVACTVCGEPYPVDAVPFRCNCGGIFDFREFPNTRDLNSIMPFVNPAQKSQKHNWITLGEGDTPLLCTQMNGKELFLKMESQNPTGSYKDRGTVALVNFLLSRGVTYALEDSSGNAGASFAGYCARAGIKARVYVPDSASGAKCNQIEAYGAELVRVPGARSEAAKVVLRAAEQGCVYASHAWMPFGLAGIAVMAYELVDQLGQVPGTVIAPVGHGGLLYGLMRGFETMQQSGFISREPQYIGVQASACSPMVEAYVRHSTSMDEYPDHETIAEGVKVTRPVRAEAILSKLLNGKGKMIAMSERELHAAWWQSAKQGFFMEPTSALSWAAFSNFSEDFKSPAVAVITGSGYKSSIPHILE
jgi:threonine synthase